MLNAMNAIIVVLILVKLYKKMEFALSVQAKHTSINWTPMNAHKQKLIEFILLSLVYWIEKYIYIYIIIQLLVSYLILRLSSI